MTTSWLFLAVSVYGALYTLNAYLPLRWAVGVGPAFFAHRLTTELAPHHHVELLLEWQFFRIGAEKPIAAFPIDCVDRRWKHIDSKDLLGMGRQCSVQPLVGRLPLAIGVVLGAAAVEHAFAGNQRQNDLFAHDWLGWEPQTDSLAQMDCCRRTVYARTSSIRSTIRCAAWPSPYGFCLTWQAAYAAGSVSN